MKAKLQTFFLKYPTFWVKVEIGERQFYYYPLFGYPK